MPFLDANPIPPAHKTFYGRDDTTAHGNAHDGLANAATDGSHQCEQEEIDKDHDFSFPA
jgi:hypothetical protein